MPTSLDLAVQAEVAKRIAARFGTEVTPLPGSELTWQQWQRKWWPKVDANSDYHVRMWEWFDSLEHDTKPEIDAMVEAIFRKGGKSSTAEAAIIWTGITAKRNFWLYVCSTQDAANEHIGNIGKTMERMGIERAISEYGAAEGWNAWKLRAANGFNVLGIGLLNSKVRGLKLDDFRPDGILLDDVDASGETLYMTNQKITTITKAILPSGSRNCVYAFVQNVIAANGIMAQTLDGRLPMMLNRVDRDPVPAIYDMEFVEYYKNGKKRQRITGGTPAWSGFTIEDCQREIEATTFDAFMQECQHDVYRTGVFFTNFVQQDHVRLINSEDGPCLVCCGDDAYHCAACMGTGKNIPAPWPIPRGWKFVGGLDYGRSDNNPFGFLLCAIDYFGNLKFVEEIYEAQLSPNEQADKILALFKVYNLKPADVRIFCDPSFFRPDEEPGRLNGGGGSLTTWKPLGKPIAGWSMITNNGRYVSDDYKAKGLNVVRAYKGNSHNVRVNGWAAVNHFLDKLGGFVIYEGRCPNFVTQITNLPRSPRDPNDADTTAVDHLPDCLIGGTLVSTPNGAVAIELLRNGDMVNTHKGPRAVTDHWTSGTFPVWELSLEDERKLTGTANHPVRSTSGFINLATLRYNDLIYTERGQECQLWPINTNPEVHALQSVRSVTPCGRATVYNLTVEDAETFYANGILVHNCARTIAYNKVSLPGSDNDPKDQPSSTSKPSRGWYG